jgi:hypothetical protein
MTKDTRAEFEAWCLQGKPADAWTNWQLCWAASRRAALEKALCECEEIADHWDAMHNTQASMAADQCVIAIRALADEGVKP